MLKNLLIGPYIGSFKYEILTFRPYIQYLLSILEYDNVYISSHYNRSFLYDHIPNSQFIPIYSCITRDEINQVGYQYLDVNKQQYNKIVKSIKSNLTDLSEHHSLPYIKSTNTISFYQKKLLPYVYPDIDIDINKDTICFIPDKSQESKDIYENIKTKYNVIVIGDINNGIEYDNILLKRFDYFDIVYKYMFNYIHKSLFVITSCPEWALICNIQNIPLVYWGNDSSMFKSDGVYGFNNNNISLKSMNINMIKYMYENMKV